MMLAKKEQHQKKAQNGFGGSGGANNCLIPMDTREIRRYSVLNPVCSGVFYLRHFATAIFLFWGCGCN